MNRSNLLLALVVLALVAGIGAPEARAQSGVVHVEVAANLVHAFPITAIRPVSFGTVTISNLSGTVVLDETTGAVSNSGGAQQVDAQTVSRGLIRFTPPVDGFVSIFPGSTSVELQDNNGNRSTGVRFAPAMELSSASVIAGQAVEVNIGGVLSFGNNTNPDTYRGTVSVTVAYT